MTKTLWKMVDLTGEELDTRILGELLTGPTQYLDVSNGKIEEDERGLQTLTQQLITHQSKLRGLRLSGV